MGVTERPAAARTVRAAVVVNPAKVDDLDGFRGNVDGALTGAGWPAPHWYETTPEEPGQSGAGVVTGEPDLQRARADDVGVPAPVVNDQSSPPAPV